MDLLHQHLADAVGLIQPGQQRRNAMGGTGGRRQYLTVVAHTLMVHAIHHDLVGLIKWHRPDDDPFGTGSQMP